MSSRESREIPDDVVVGRTGVPDLSLMRVFLSEIFAEKGEICS